MNNQLAESDDPEGRPHNIIYLDQRRPSTPPPAPQPENINDQRRSSIGTLRPPPPPPANEVVTDYETDFLGILEIIQGQLNNLQIRHDQLRNDPQFDAYRFAVYLVCRDHEPEKHFSKEEISLYQEYEEVKKSWDQLISGICDLVTRWHNKLFALLHELKTKQLQPEFQEKIKKYLASLRDQSHGNMTWQITKANVEHFKKFVAVNLAATAESALE